MNILTSSKSFRIGVLVGGFIFAILNIWVFVSSGRMGTTIGFPLPIYIDHYTSPFDVLNPEASHFEYFIPGHIVINLFLILFSCLGIGVVFEVGSNLFARLRGRSPIK